MKLNWPKTKHGRFIVNDHLRVIVRFFNHLFFTFKRVNEYKRLIPFLFQTLRDVYAIGDCAEIEGNPLMATAQVAVQQARYLAKSIFSPLLISRLETLF
jgi:NADH dehydrogenase